MAGSPPQHETLDYKPELANGTEPCPDELMAGRVFPFIKGRPEVAGSAVSVLATW